MFKKKLIAITLLLYFIITSNISYSNNTNINIHEVKPNSTIFQKNNSEDDKTDTDSPFDFDNTKTENDADSEESPSEIEKLRNTLSNLDLESLKSIAEALSINILEDDDKDIIIQKILDRIEILPKEETETTETEDDEAADDSEDSDVVKDSGQGRTEWTSPISGESWSINYDTLTTKIFNVKNDKYTQLIAFGNCVVTYGDTTLSSDAIIVNRPPPEAKDTQIEVMIIGNINVKSGNNTFIAEEAFFYPDTQRSILYDVIAFFPDSTEFAIRADSIKLVDGTEEVIGKDIEATTSYLEFPHYMFNSSKIWYYPDSEYMFASNLTFQIGQSKLLYFPLLFQSQFSSGIRTDFRHLRGMGFYIQTSTPFDIFGYKNTLYLDYYQKMGIFFTLAEAIKIGPVTIDFAGAYDRAIADSSRPYEIFTNYVDIDNDGIADETFNSFRYDFSISTPLTIYEGEKADLEKYLEEKGNTDLLENLNNSQMGVLESFINEFMANISVSANASFSKRSDPNFSSQFLNSPRSETFDIMETIDYREYARSESSPSVPASGSAMSLDTNISASSSGISFGLKGSWAWSFVSRAGELNPYDVLNYYDVQLTSANFPSISMGFGSTISNNLIDDVVKLIMNIINPENEFTSINDKLENFTIKLPLSYSFSFSHNTRKTYYTGGISIKPDESYIEEKAGELKRDFISESITFNYRLPFSVSYDFISFSAPMSYKLTYKYQNTRDFDEDSSDIEEIILNDLENTKFNWAWSFNPSLSIDLFRDFEFLNFTLNFGVNFSYKGEFEDLVYQLGLKETEIGDSKTTSKSITINDSLGNISITFLKCVLAFSGLSLPSPLSDTELERLGDIEVKSARDYTNDDTVVTKSILVDKAYLQEENKPSTYVLSFNISNELIKGFSFRISYTENIRYDDQDYVFGRDYVLENFGYFSLFGGKSHSLSINTGYTMNIEQLIFNTILIESLSIHFSYNHFFDKFLFKNDNIQITFDIDMHITTLWTLNISYSVNNTNLWRYTAHQDNPDKDNPRNFFYDILMSFAFWDIESLMATYWKMQQLSLSLTHDLAEWKMSVGINLQPRIVDNVLVVQPTFSISIVLIDLPDFSGGIDGKGKIDKFIYDRY